ncbi:MAG: copper chaperone PCu(A)C [Hyphomicrobiales bacterium]|nr:copper chaperone PCu(A)C [Hyphomicrobiales bacterium]
MKHFAKLALSGALMLVSVPSMAEMITHGSLELHDAWTRAMPPGARAGGGFMVIKNTGSEADRLVGGTSPNAGRIEIHEMAVINDIMKMRPVEGGLVIAAGASVELKPGGYHVMFLDVPKSFVEGETVTVTLDFAKAGSIEVKMPVMAIGTGARMHMHQGKGMMQGMGGMQGMSGMQGQ